MRSKPYITHVVFVNDLHSLLMKSRHCEVRSRIKNHFFPMLISTNTGTAESILIKLTTVVRRSEASHQIVTNLRHARSSRCYLSVSYICSYLLLKAQYHFSHSQDWVGTLDIISRLILVVL